MTGLSVGATLMLYDGNPFHPNPSVLFDYASDERITFFGVSAKYIDALRNSGLSLIDTHGLSSIQTIASTGSPLSPQNFKFIYEHIKGDVHLASVSGGTDIVGCFVNGVPWHSVFAGEIQGATLGMATDVWDEDGVSVVNSKGELVPDVMILGEGFGQ